MNQPALFHWGGFRSTAGHRLPFKIDCDALTDADIHCIANVIASQTTFRAVYSVFTGGDRLGLALIPFQNDENSNRIIIVDDVLTTGGSMEATKKRVQRNYGAMGVEFTGEIVGWVIFARKKPADWINAVFTLGEAIS